MFGVPDENSHFISSLGATSFDFDTKVRVEGFYSAGSDCFIFRPDVPSTCYEKSWDPSPLTLETTTDGYTPFFYIVASIPLHIVNGPSSFIVARLWITLVNFLILAIGLSSLLKPRVTLQTNVLTSLLILPFPAYIIASVNPSGMAYSLAFTTTVLLVGTFQGALSRWQSLMILPFLLGFLLVRRDSIIWLVILLIALSLTSDFRRFVRAKLPSGNRFLKIFLLCSTIFLIFVASNAASYAFSFSSSFSSLSFDDMKFGLGQVYINFIQFLGIFGWLTVTLPNEIYVLSAVLLFSLFTGVFVLGEKSYRSALEATIVLTILMLIFANALRPSYVQGRYILPAFSFAVVFSVFALKGFLTTNINRIYILRFSVLWTLSFTLVSGIAFLQVAKRFSHGEPSSFADGLRERIGILVLPGYIYLCFYVFGVLLFFLPLFRLLNEDSKLSG